MTENEKQKRMAQINQQMDALISEMEELQNLRVSLNPYPKDLAPNIELEDVGIFQWGNAYNTWLTGKQWETFKEAEIKKHKKCYYCGEKSETFHHIKYGITIYNKYGSKNINDWINPLLGVCVCNKCHEKITQELRDRQIELTNFIDNGNDEL